MKFDRELVNRMLAGLLTAAAVGAIGWAAKKEFPWLAAGLGLLLGYAISTFFHWIRNVPFAPRIRGSRFEFVKFVQNANKSIFVVGPCLNHLAVESKAKEIIFQKLAARDFQV